MLRSGIARSFYEDNITMIPNPDKDITHKKENYRPLSLINIEAKIFKNNY